MEQKPYPPPSGNSRPDIVPQQRRWASLEGVILTQGAEDQPVCQMRAEYNEILWAMDSPMGALRVEHHLVGSHETFPKV